MRTERYHVAGVAGVGMNAIAQVLHLRGAHVSGSDRYADQGVRVPVLDKLERSGIELHAQDGRAVHKDLTALVVSTAIEEDNAEVVRARELGVPVVHRADMLARVVKGQRCLAVAGTSGKTTVTGMLGWLLTELGLDPNVVNGGALVNWRTADAVGNVRMGKGDLWVVEADESDRSFLVFDPEWAVINTISHDHFPLSETITLFGDFASRVRSTLFVDADVSKRLDQAAKETGQTDTAQRCDARAGVVYDDSAQRFEMDGTTFRLRIPGRHNLENAAMAVSVCRFLGADDQATQAALARFEGMERRLECAGTVRGVTVYDEYAHNPEKIGAAWRTMRGTAKRVLGVWRPHGFGPLAQMADDLFDLFASLCRNGDRIYLLPVFYAGGTTNKLLTSETFVERLQAGGIPAVCVPDYDALLEALRAEAREGDTVLVMGARDPGLPVFARRLVDNGL